MSILQCIIHKNVARKISVLHYLSCFTSLSQAYMYLTVSISVIKS